MSVPIQADNKLGKVCCLWGPLMLRQAHDDPYKGDGAGIPGERCEGTARLSCTSRHAKEKES